MKNLKRNQIIIFVIALMLVTAGYLSFTTNDVQINTIETSVNLVETEDIASIGDAKLVSSKNIIETNTIDGIISDEPASTTVNENLVKNNIVSNEIVTTSSKELNEYFSSSKLTRDTMYSQMLESYEKILENQNISADQKVIAQNEIKNINDMKNKIMICENLIQTKGIDNCVIFVNGDSVSVVVTQENLEQDKIAQIQNIITREMQVDINNIHISNK